LISSSTQRATGRFEHLSLARETKPTSLLRFSRQQTMAQTLVVLLELWYV